jgi:hypothetical protein
MVGRAPAVRLRPAALVALGGLIVGLVFTYPLVRHVREAVPYTYGADPRTAVQGLVPSDQLQLYYFLSLTDDMLHGRVPWFEDAYEFSAPRPASQKSFFFLPFSFLFAAIAPLGRVLALNVPLLASFPATAVAGFLLARRVGLAAPAAAVVAAVLAASPYRVANVAGGHPAGFAFFLVPLALHLVEAARQTGRRGLAFGAGLALLCLALNEPHFFYFFAWLLPLWAGAALLRVEDARTVAAGDAARSLVWLSLAALGPTAFLVFRETPESEPWTAAAVSLQFAVALALLVGAWRVTAEVRARSGEQDPWESEAKSYLPLLLLVFGPLRSALAVPHLGAATMAIALAGLAVAKRPFVRAIVATLARPEYRAAVRDLARAWPLAFGLFAGAAFLLYYKSQFIAPAGHAAGRSFREIALFSPWPGDFVARDNTELTRQLYLGAAVAVLAVFALRDWPGRILVAVAAVSGALALGPHAPPWLPLHRIAYHAVPFFGFIRQPAKLFAVTLIALALAAGFGVSRLARHCGDARRSVVCALAVAAILLDFSAVLPLGLTQLPKTNRVYGEIAANGAGSNVLELPLWPGDSAYSSLYQYWSTVTRVPIVNGYSPTAPRDYVERVFRPLATLNVGELDEAQHRLLDDLRVRYVTLHRDAFPPKVNAYPYRFTLDAMRANPNLEYRGEADGVYLFERAERRYEPWNARRGSPLGVFFEAESLKVGSGAAVTDVDASSGALVRGSVPGDPRPVIFGPYRTFPAGAYEARFRAAGRGRVEVSTDLGARTLAEGRVDVAALDEIALEFALGQPSVLEFRAFADRPGALGVDWVLVRKLDGAPSDRVEAEDLVARSGSVDETADASGGAAAVVVASAAPAGAIVLDGPFREFDPGTVDVTVRARGGPVRVSIESVDGRRKLAEVSVPAESRWHVSTAIVEVPSRLVLCARVVSAGVDAEIDYVDLTARPAKSRESSASETSGGAGPR